MRAYGYEVWGADVDLDDPNLEDPPLLSLRETTLLCSFDDIRRVARFMNEIVAKIDSGYFTGELEGHVHFQDEDASWTEEESDLIVYWNPRSS
jgi:hypothetical protein